MPGFLQLNMSYRELKIQERLSWRIGNRTHGSACLSTEEIKLTCSKMHVNEQIFIEANVGLPLWLSAYCKSEAEMFSTKPGR